MAERVNMNIREDGYIDIVTTSTITSKEATMIDILENPQHSNLGVGRQLASELLPYADKVDYLTLGPNQLTFRLRSAVRDTEIGQEVIQDIYRRVWIADDRAKKPEKGISRFDKAY